MKVSLNNSIQANKRLAFMGFEPAKDEFGEKYYNWSYPYDSNHYDCYLDVFPVTPDKNGDYEHNTFDKPYKNILNGENTIKLQPGNNKIYLDYIFGRVEDAPFAYQYRLLPKNNPDAIPIFQVDPGDLIDKRDFNSDWKMFSNGSDFKDSNNKQNVNYIETLFTDFKISDLDNLIDVMDADMFNEFCDRWKEKHD